MTDGGDCYQAAHVLMLEACEQGKVEQMFLCHGTVTGEGPIQGIRYGHAWVEREGSDVTMVLDASNGRFVVAAKAEYYRRGKITDVRRYAIKEVFEKTLLHEHYGPWED